MSLPHCHPESSEAKRRICNKFAPSQTSPPSGGAGGGLNLPITLPAYALSHKVVNQLRLYLYLKSVCSGHFKVDERSVQHACEFLDLKSHKSFYKNLNWLILQKWITFNSISNNCRVISFTRLCYKLNITTRTGVLFETKDFKHFRPFLYAAVIAWSIRRKDWHQRQPAPKKGGTRKSMPGHRPGPGFNRGRSQSQLPNRYLAKILQLDHSTISRYKLATSTAGYINTEHQFEDTQLSLKFLYSMQKYLPEEAHLLVAHNNTVQRQLPDVITHSIHLKHRRPRPP
jgi:hypothetical protein